MTHDWPENMSMSSEAFGEYATKLEREDFELDIRNLSASLHQLVEAREDTIRKLRLSADYLDSIWFRCKISRSLGTSASVVGGGLTIAGGILTLSTAGAAAPLLIAGIATSSVGAATNIGTSVIEKVINSKQVKEMGGALTVDKELTLKIESQIDDLRRYKDSVHLGALLVAVEQLLGSSHILVAILQSIFVYDTTGLIGMSARFFSTGIHNTIVGINGAKSVAMTVAASSSNLNASAAGAAGLPAAGALMEVVPGTNALLGSAPVAAATGTPAAGVAAAGVAAAAVAASAVECSGNMCRTTVKAKDGLKYNPLGPDIFLETGKVVGQNSTRLAGKVIVGVSAAFLVWDAIDLGFTVADLVRKKGSQASKILRDKADELEEAMNETKAKYKLDLMTD